MVECVDPELSIGGEEIDGGTDINLSRLVSGSSGSKWGSGDGRQIRVG